MRKIKRIVSFGMACILLFSSMNVSVYATEMEDQTELVETTEVTESTEVTEITETTETTEVTEATEVTEITEMTESTEVVEDTGATEVSKELEAVATEVPKTTVNFMNYDDILEMEGMIVSQDEIEGEIYDAEELIEMAENMPSMMSETYNSEWDAYSSYYIYNQLSADGKKLWDALEVLCASYMDNEEDITYSYLDFVRLESTEITAYNVGDIVWAFKYSNPQYYFLSNAYRISYNSTSISVSLCVYDAFASGAARKTATTAIKTLLDEWYKTINACSTEEEKVKVIHDLICNKVNYNNAILDDDDGDGYGDITSEEEQAEFTQSAYSVFCTDLTVCAGYTQAFTWVCNGAGIETFGVTSSDHGWNKIRVNDNWYNMDCTWDDDDSTIYYYCYLKNDVYIDGIGSHIEEALWNAYLPVCTLDSGSNYRGAGTLPTITQQVAAPVLGITKGDTSYTVEISTATEGATIYYTIDGRTPAESGSKSYIYKEPIEVDVIENLKVIATCNEYLDSEVVTGSYEIIESGTCGTNITWQIDSTGCLILSGSGEMTSYANYGATPWYDYASDITTIQMKGAITSISPYAFYGMTNLQSIAIADTVTTIGKYAFHGSGIEKIEIPSGVKTIAEFTFAECSNLQSVLIPDTVTLIEKNAFDYSGLTEVVIPTGVERIGAMAFRECDALKTVTVNGSLCNLSEDDYLIFTGCDALQSVVIGDAVQILGLSMFSGCPNLAEVSLGTGLKTIQDSAFSGTGIKKIVIPSNVTAIGASAFSSCASLTSVEIYANVESIPATMFWYCGNLSEVIYSDNIKSISGRAFGHCTSLTDFEIRDSVTTIAANAFVGCTGLTQIYVPKTVTTITEGAFDTTLPIVGYTGSAAETYATTYGNEFINIEDVGVKVTFVTYSDETVAAQICYPGRRATEPAAIEKAGYLFEGWYTSAEVMDDSTKWDFTNDVVTADITLYANWTPNTYELSFDLNYDGAESISTKSVTYNAAYGTLPTVSRDDYTFAGWYTQAVGGEQITEDTIYDTASNVTIYAHWISNTYTIAFDANGGTVDTVEKEVTSGGIYGELPTPTREGYRFNGWYTQISGGNQITEFTLVNTIEPHTLYAQWTANKYEVTFDANGGTVGTEKITVTYDSVYGELPTPVRAGFTFTGWKDASGNTVTAETIVAIAGNHTLYASWQGEAYVVFFEAGEGSVEPSSETVYYGAEYGELPTATLEGYTFVGWYTKDDNLITAESIVEIAENHILYAKYNANEYKVLFDANGGTVELTEKKVTYDETYGELPVPARDGYTFKGWYADATFANPVTADSEVKILEDQTLYAQWEVNQYEVTFDANGGSLSDEVATVKEVTFDAAYGELPVAERSGYDFMGWETEDGTEVTAETIVSIADNHTLYAKWQGKAYTVIFEVKNGSIETKSLTVYYGSAYGELPVPTLEGYTFSGWYTAAEEGTLINAESIVEIAEDHILYAEYAPNTYKVFFDADGGTLEVTEISVSYDGTYGELPTPTIAGGTFLGWYTQDGTKVEAGTPVKILADQTLYAHWEFRYTVETPVASISTGTEVEAGTRVSITSGTNGARIYYTTDPTIGLGVSAGTGILYEDALSITENVTIYAIAVKEGHKDSEVLITSYTVIDDSLDWGDITVEDQVELAENGVTTPADVPTELWVAGVFDCDYTGKAITYPNLHVYSHKTLLQEKVDYTVKYKNNTKAGTATVTITGKGNYAGTIEKTFTIRPLDLSKATVLDVTLPFTGRVQKATTTVTYELDGKVIKLKSGSDFTYTYPGTNKKADDYNPDAFAVAGDHTVILTGKGNYTGEKTFVETITTSFVIGKMKLTKIKDQPYNDGNAVEPEIVLMNGKEQLDEDVDFTVKYENNTEVGTATVTITGEGKYEGTMTTTFKIKGTALSKMKLNGFSSSLPWAEGAVTQNVTFSYTVGSGADKVTNYLTEDKDYTVEYVNNEKVGTATVIFTGKGGYTGTIKKTFKINGLAMSKAAVEGLPTSVAYDGKEVTLSGYSLTYTTGKGEEAQTVSLVEGKDYTVSYKNNAKAGTANIIFTGINNYTGSLKKSFKITQYDFTSTEGKVSMSIIADQAYTKGGVSPKPVVTYTDDQGNETVLVAGKDYTLKYTNNKAIANKTDAKAPSVTITGKGNFKGKLTQAFTIIGSDLSVTTMTAKDIVYKNKAGTCKTTITLYDTDGKKLSAGTDYKKNIVYTYAKDVEVTQLVNKQIVYITREEGKEVDKNDIIPVGAEITATAKGMKNYFGAGAEASTQSVTFRYVASDISKASVKVAAQTYTGKAVEPTKDDITVKIGKETLAKTDYEIVSYSNNVKKGTAKVTIRGIGNYGGEKTVTFKINTRTMNYVIKYDKNADDATGKMNASTIAAGKKLSANSYKRTGYKFVGWTTGADGSGYFYDNKEAFYLKGFMWIFGREVTLYAQWEPN
ncbi:MAG: InlB B-repeat-containing protein [Roseburia sp.]|nr:InlB B-repeat-containing protein [Roseburia sp.]